MRIAVGGIHTECSTYNPVLNEEKDFRVVRGEALLEAPYFAFLKDYDADFLPTIHARAIFKRSGFACHLRGLQGRIPRAAEADAAA